MKVLNFILTNFRKICIFQSVVEGKRGDVPSVGSPPLEEEHHGSEALERARKRTQGSPSPC